MIGMPATGVSACAGCRAASVTSWPAARNASAMLPPMPPVPPTTSVFTRGSALLSDLEFRHRADVVDDACLGEFHDDRALLELPLAVEPRVAVAIGDVHDEIVVPAVGTRRQMMRHRISLAT